MSPQIAHIITSLDEGGAEAALYRLCCHGPRGRQRVVCLMSEGKYGPLLRQAGVQVNCLGLRRGQLSARAMLRLWRLLRRLQPDLVQTWMYHSDIFGGLVARLAGVPRVVWGVRTSQLDASVVSRSTLLLRRICALLSWLVPDRIVCCAERASLVHRQLGYPADRLVVIPNGYDLDALQPDPATGARLRSQIGLSAAGPLLAMVARFDPQKDHRTLLKALALLRADGLTPHCLLVGSCMDASNATLQAWLQQLGVAPQVHLLGSRRDVAAVMSAATLHVLSSAVEAFPNVLAEAMACGVPCVATDVGDSGLIIGSTGWLVPPRDPRALADALALALRESDASYRARCLAARERIATRFSVGLMVDRYMGLYGALA
jgi:glycosyltransferase involved in cell wall biosynthesis